MYKTADFDFDLPEELIAKNPVTPRDEAKMLVYKDGEFMDKQVMNITDYLSAGDVIVFNDTKVIKAKLYGTRDDVAIEINLHQNLQKNIWQVFAKPAKRLKPQDQFIIADDFYAVVINKNEEGLVELEFNCEGEEFFLKLEKYGHMPLPSYIKRAHEKSDEKNYQTIYAANPGAVAAPTAGLHFTEKLFTELEKKGIEKAFVTLNVGAGTFLPVKSELIQDHQMHSEFFTIDEKACEIINKAKKSGKKIVVVGTTSLRVLESSSDAHGHIYPQDGHTRIFIYPPYKFKIVDILMTNFHLPKSTLFMLVSAFIGHDKANELYNHAIKNNYRFYSYGDSCLLFR